jgi:hypothetical protein
VGGVVVSVLVTATALLGWRVWTWAWPLASPEYATLIDEFQLGPVQRATIALTLALLAIGLAARAWARGLALRDPEPEPRPTPRRRGAWRWLGVLVGLVALLAVADAITLVVWGPDAGLGEARPPDAPALPWFSPTRAFKTMLEGTYAGAYGAPDPTNWSNTVVSFAAQFLWPHVWPTVAILLALLGLWIAARRDPGGLVPLDAMTADGPSLRRGLTLAAAWWVTLLAALPVLGLVIFLIPIWVMRWLYLPSP